MYRIDDIKKQIALYNPNFDEQKINRAYVFSAKAHKGQKRLSGEPYLSHPIDVAYILASQMQLDLDSIIAGLLHDVMEDADVSYKKIAELFGEDVANIVDGVTKISKYDLPDLKVRKAESIRKLILSMIKDVRVILVKLADRMHNMLSLQHHAQEKQYEIAQETYDIYVPIAARLGTYEIKNRLAERCFIYLHPEEYRKIKALTDQTLKRKEQYIDIVKKTIQERFRKEGLECEVFGRVKQVESIYRKMKKKNLDYEDLYDIIAFRILVNKEQDCFSALGYIYSMWSFIPGKFKNYIGKNAKPNGYQSLHTAVIGPEAKRIEIQIRTHEMDKVAQSGIAAHWAYKEGKMMDKNILQAFEWLQDILENQEGINDSNEFLNNVKIDLYATEVNVFTPGGEIKTLPRGATPVDFAYAIHSDIGNTCHIAKANGTVVPLDYQLKNGEQVEIITSIKQFPKASWLNFVKTVKAKNKIKHQINIQEREKSMALGQELCDKIFKKYKLDFAKIAKTDKFAQTAKEFGFTSEEELIGGIGAGQITPLQLVKKFAPKEQFEQYINKKENRPTKEISDKQENNVLVGGSDDILVKLARCCNPIYGDPIRGFITHGQGISVHLASCVNVPNFDPTREIDVSWKTEAPSKPFKAKLVLKSYDRLGLVADLTKIVTRAKINIIDITSRAKENEEGFIYTKFILNVKNKDELEDLIKKLKKNKSTIEVERKDLSEHHD